MAYKKSKKNKNKQIGIVVFDDVINYSASLIARV